MLFQKILDIFSKKNNIRTLFLVDILYVKDLNAIYDFKNGDFIIRQLDSILKTNIKELIIEELKRDISINIKNTHADVFEIYLLDDLSIEEIVIVKNIIYESIVSNNFKLLDNYGTINIDITIGCAKSEDQHIKIYAEKALYNAKLNFIHYMYKTNYSWTSYTRRPVRTKSRISAKVRPVCKTPFLVTKSFCIRFASPKVTIPFSELNVFPFPFSILILTEFFTTKSAVE